MRIKYYRYNIIGSPKSKSLAVFPLKVRSTNGFDALLNVYVAPEQQ